MWYFGIIFIETILFDVVIPFISGVWCLQFKSVRRLESTRYHWIKLKWKRRLLFIYPPPHVVNYLCRACSARTPPSPRIDTSLKTRWQMIQVGFKWRSREANMGSALSCEVWNTGRWVVWKVFFFGFFFSRPYLGYSSSALAGGVLVHYTY